MLEGSESCRHFPCAGEHGIHTIRENPSLPYTKLKHGQQHGRARTSWLTLASKLPQHLLLVDVRDMTPPTRARVRPNPPDRQTKYRKTATSRTKKLNNEVKPKQLVLEVKISSAFPCALPTLNNRTGPEKCVREPLPPDRKKRGAAVDENKRKRTLEHFARISESQAMYPTVVACMLSIVHQRKTVGVWSCNLSLKHRSPSRVKSVRLSNISYMK